MRKSREEHWPLWSSSTGLWSSVPFINMSTSFMIYIYKTIIDYHIISYLCKYPLQIYSFLHIFREGNYWADACRGSRVKVKMKFPLLMQERLLFTTSGWHRMEYYKIKLEKLYLFMKDWQLSDSLVMHLSNDTMTWPYLL